MEYSGWTDTCCQVLERQFEVEGDQRLAWLVRCTYIIEQTSKIDRHKNRDDAVQDEKEARFMLRGLEAQFREWKDSIPQHLITSGSKYPLSNHLRSPDVARLTRPGALHIATTFAELYLNASPLLRYGTQRTPSKNMVPSPINPEPARLARCLPILRGLFDELCALPQSAFTPVTSIDWGKLIQITILSLRLSLPLTTQCTGWDDAAAREVLQFGAFLEQFSRPDTEQEQRPRAPGSGISVLSASKIVFNVVRHKYEGRLAKLQAPDMAVVRGLRGCPMLDGSLEEYFPAWDPAISAPSMGTIGWSGHAVSSGEAVEGSGSSGTSLTGDVSMGQGGESSSSLDDMWSAMTQNWAGDEAPVQPTMGTGGSGLGGCPYDHGR